MSDRIIIIGGGPNGLTAAGLLAKAGRDVLLLEARDRFGGMAARETFHEGYIAPGLLHDTRGVRPHVVADLELERFGLRRREHAPAIWAPTTGGGGIWLDGDAVRGDVDYSDAARYAELRGFIDKVRPVVARVMDSHPLSPDANLWSLLKTGWALRRLGARTMMELIRVVPMCVADWMGDHFKSERLASAIALPAVIGAYTGVRSPHTAATLLVQEAMAGAPIAGGGWALVDALVGAAEAQGAVLRRGTQVVSIDGDRDGVTGVTLADGERLLARVVLSTLDPKTTFLGLFGRRRLSVGFVQDLERYRMRGTTAKVHLALSGPLLNDNGAVIEAMRTGDTLDAIERAYDAAKYRRYAEVPALDVTVPSIADPSLCPPGHAVVSIVAHAAAYDLEGGWTAAQRDALGDTVIRTLATHCPSLPDRIVDAEVLTPADIEARYGVTGGHVLHGEHAPDQLLFLRPTRECGHYRTPVPRLYLGGAGTHPGGGLTGGPGALAARAILDAKAGVEPSL